MVETNRPSVITNLVQTGNASRVFRGYGSGENGGSRGHEKYATSQSTVSRIISLCFRCASAEENSREFLVETSGRY